MAILLITLPTFLQFLEFYLDGLLTNIEDMIEVSQVHHMNKYRGHDRSLSSLPY